MVSFWLFFVMDFSGGNQWNPKGCGWWWVGDTLERLFSSTPSEVKKNVSESHSKF